ncbi:hypothetical protein ABMA27_008744 [Loxostege sticticalis]|uniref:Uncharacterized protein n=1 Tax=Loxostege sticticalis TaxID=481309 RepID=A0ABR3HCN8_LOXSC
MMELKVFGFVLMFSLSLAAPFHGDFYDYSFGEFDHRKPEKADIKQETQSDVAKFYEVVENVDDIPNPNPVGNPLIANYTTGKPLNVVPENANIDNSNVAVGDIVNYVTPTVEYKPINNPYDSDFEKENLETDEVDLNFDVTEQEQPSLRSYVFGLLKNAFINGLKSLIQKLFFRNENKYIQEDPNEHSNLVFLLEKLRKNSYEDRSVKYFGHEYEHY